MLVSALTSGAAARLARHREMGDDPAATRAGRRVGRAGAVVDVVGVGRGRRDRDGRGARALLDGIRAREGDRLDRRELIAERTEAAELAAQAGRGERPGVVVAMRGRAAVEGLDGTGRG